MSGVLQRFRPLFEPEAVAFVGASSDTSKWGFRILHNIVNGGYTGRVYPVNPGGGEVLGLRVWTSLREVPEQVDLAVIVVPPTAVPGVLRDCIALGVRAGVLITAGYAEMGEEGQRLQEEAAALARQGGMALVGPNTNGVQSATVRLRSTMPPLMPKPGGVAIVSQSGNIGLSTMWRLINAGVGMSRYIAAGNEAVLQCADYLEYLREDPQTTAIVVYMEGIRNGRRFFDVARRVNRRKPIVVLKGGLTEAGTQAARSHSGALSGSDPIFSALCRQAGLIRVADVDELFFLGAALATQPLPQGNRVGIVTTGGGWGVLAADACARAGLQVVALPAETLSVLDTILPPWWSHGNPVDLVAGLRDGDMRRSVEAVLKSPNVDAVIMLGISQGQMWHNAFATSPYAAAYGLDRSLDRLLAEDRRLVEDLVALRQEYRKPIVCASDAGQAGPMPGGAPEAMARHGLVLYSTPQEAALVMSSLVRYADFRGRVGEMC